MLKERRIERHQLQDYLQVFNRLTDRSVGCLGNVSENGMMVISDLPMLTGAKFELRLKVPNNGGQKFIDVQATCMWCKEDETPGSYDSGFLLIDAPDDYLDFIHMLRRYFSFYPLEASA
ncbi:PilZ domain-containing protein [Pseudomonas sp. v388]|uniref:PilZ domain-containing protein n=1 Tax=Pseudomonas sp. v388 TaxID=2479849 RepID=UPI000F7A26E9|nr:PilZ domain-containing protein [Pseudomonas sp. v388]RRV07022.1 PilZ domain-containing protein [Pseudomonas sp. v388]